ncbi:MAG TPA: hypothetical protein P5074_02080, partial [Candidatus Nanopelagicales bacterium]|nr:hypothetical protein [Candidatus Nanopelagicales bacterium]
MTHRRGAFLRAQMLRIRQRIDLIVDLVEPGRSCCRQARPDPGPAMRRPRHIEKRRRRRNGHSTPPIDNNLECRIGGQVPTATSLHELTKTN